MNADRILQVADAIEQHSIPWLGFNMNFFKTSLDREYYANADKSGHGCGTVACIAGWTSELSDDPAVQSFRTAAEWLDLDYDEFDPAGAEANLLFFGAPRMKLSNITQEQAVRTLRHLAATGEVDWTV